MADNIRLDITPDSDPLGTPIESWTEEEFSDLRLEISLNDLGRNTFRIPRRTWEISSLSAFRTYYVRVYIPYINDPGAYWGFWLIGGEYILVSTDESGGEDITIGGPGPGWILSKAVLNWQEWIQHAGVMVQDGTWYFEDKTYGEILIDLLDDDAASDYPVLGDMGSPGWGAVNDVDGNPWEEFGGIFSQEVGTDYLTVMRALQKAGDLDIWVNQNLDLKASAAIGEDRTGSAYGSGVVRFVGSSVTPDENQNILGSLTRHKETGKTFTHLLVLGNDRVNDNGVIVEGSPIHHWVVSPHWSPGEAIHQGVLSFPTNKVAILERVGLRYIKRSRDRSHLMVSAEVMPGQDESQGLYLPGNDLTDRGNFFIGDLTTWKTGAGNDLDLTDTDLAIAKIRVQIDSASRDSTDEEKERSLRVFVETGDDVSPSGSAASAVNANVGKCHCKTPHPAPICEPSDGTDIPDEAISADWTTSDPTRVDPVTSVPGDPWGHIGQQTGGVCGNDTRVDANESSQYFAVVAGTTLIVTSAIAKVGGSVTTGARIDWFNAGLGNFADSVESVWSGWSNDANCVWSNLSLSFTVPTGAVWAKFSVGVHAHVKYLYAGEETEPVVCPPFSQSPDEGGDSPYFARSDDPRLGTLFVEELDGDPVVRASLIQFPDGTLTDNADGSVTYTPTVTPASAGATQRDISAMHRYPLWAHRGDIGSTDSKPEQTIEALRQAVLKGCEGVECDFWPSSDGTFWSMHDASVTRTTTSTGDVSSKTDAQMAALVIDAGFGYISGSFSVPTLAQVIDALRPYDAVLKAQIKFTAQADVESFAQEIIDNDYVSRTIIEVNTITLAGYVKGVSESLTTMINGATSGDTDADWGSYEASGITNLAYSTSRAPKRIGAYVSISDYGADESTWFQNAFDRGASSFQTNNVDTALALRKALIYGSGSEPTADAHIADTTDAHDASAVSIVDSGGYYTGTEVETALQEIGADIASFVAASGHYEVIVSGTAPPVAVTNPAETDWVYGWVSD